MKSWLLPSLLAVTLVSGGYLVQTQIHGQATPPAGAELSVEPFSYRHIVKKVLPAVVSIETKVKTVAVNRKRPQLPQGIPDEFRKFFDEMPDSSDSPRHGFGSGFFIDPSGVILTNHHVVNGATEVVVQLQDGRKFTSKVVHTDSRTDLAVVKVDLQGSTVPYLEMGDSAAMEVGDRVLAVGAPFGLAGTVTHGIISAKGRNGLNMNMYEDFIQTDAAINPGNSGGPLVNLEGKVVGINAAIKSRSGGFQGVGLAVASNLAKKVTQSLLKDGVVHRGYLGVQIRELDAEVAQRLGAPKSVGILVSEVYDDTPAAKAGIQAGDVITSVAGNTVKDGRSLQNAVAYLTIGKAVDVVIVRDGKTMTKSVTVQEQPREFGVTSSNSSPSQPSTNPEALTVDKVGVEVSDLDQAKAKEMGFRSGVRGALITRVDNDSIASEAGLRRGMLISKVDGKVVTNAQEFRKAMEKASMERGVVVQVHAPNGGTNFVLLRSVVSTQK